MTSALRPLGLIVLAAALLTSAGAQTRDPTRPPEAAPSALAASAAGAAASLPAYPSVVVLGGQARVLAQGRLLGVGDRLGDARIERIDTQGVWLREGAQRRRLPLYPPLQAAAAASAAARHAPLSDSRRENPP